jgi:hypothetical protein
VASTCGLSSPVPGFYETGSIYSDNALMRQCSRRNSLAEGS